VAEVNVTVCLFLIIATTDTEICLNATVIDAFHWPFRIQNTQIVQCAAKKLIHMYPLKLFLPFSF